MNREVQPRPELQEVISTTKTVQGRKDCLHSDRSNCKGGIIRAHSVQRALLAKIARGGHVYGWNYNLGSLMKTDGRFSTKKIGLKDASTFTGFCSAHDDSTFSAIEKEAVRPDNYHALLLAYRALCREYYTKVNQLTLSEYQKSLDRGLSPEEQFIVQKFTADYQAGINIGLKDLEHHKRLYDPIVTAAKSDGVRSCWFKIDGQPDFACAGGIFPEVDFAGRKLQEFGEEGTTLDMIFFSMLPGETNGLAVFSWLDPSPTSAALIESLLSLDPIGIPHAITRFAFEFYENIFIAPDWWDRLPEPHQTRLVDRAQSSTMPYTERRTDCLVDDGQRIATWNVAVMYDLR